MSKSFRLYLGLLVVLAAAILATANWGLPEPSASAWNALSAFAVVCFVSEAYYFRLRVGRTETQSSVAFIPYIASFLLFQSGWASLVTGGSMLVVESGIRRKPVFKVIFNAAQITIAIGLASRLFSLMGGVPSVHADSLRMPPQAVAAAIAVYFLTNSTAVSIAVTLDLGESLRTAWVRIVGASFFYDLFSSPIGALLAYLYARFEVPGILILVLPLYFIRHIYQVNLQLEQVNRDLLELMVKAIEARDPYTSGHSQRVSQLAALLAKAMGLGAKTVEQVRTAALLHDVGKIHEEYAPLLRKEGKLDATERALMQTHSIRSAELAGTISAFRGSIVDAVRHHHERFDGTGYPAGLAGEAIPIGARLIMIADTVDAMTTDRPYRKALTLEQVHAELRRCAGTQFDPRLVDVFMQSAAIRDLIGGRIPVGQRVSLPQMPSSRWRRAVEKSTTMSSGQVT